MKYYWDTSALLALIFKESRTAEMHQLAFKSGALPAYTSFFTFIEIESALFRRLAENSVTHSHLPEIRSKIQEIEQTLAPLWPQLEILTQSKKIVTEYGLKPADSLILATFLFLQKQLKEITFVTLDKKLSRVAKNLGGMTIL